MEWYCGMQNYTQLALSSPYDYQLGCALET
jgi:hypothetical protein